jgi:hypothetical protein
MESSLLAHLFLLLPIVGHALDGGVRFDGGFEFLEIIGAHPQIGSDLVGCIGDDPRDLDSHLWKLPQRLFEANSSGGSSNSMIDAIQL